MKHHPVSCETATTRKCTCYCKGMYHGAEIQSRLFVMDDEQLTVEYGGDVAEEIQKLQGKKFTCFCKHIFDLTGNFQIFGYGPHDGGYADKNGKKWWMYLHCPECEYEWALWKLPNREIKE